MPVLPANVREQMDKHLDILSIKLVPSRGDCEEQDVEDLRQAVEDFKKALYIN